MDPTKAPNFKPTNSAEEPYPPLTPSSEIPDHDPIVPFVVADYNTSIDAPIHPSSYKKFVRRNSILSPPVSDVHGFTRIPLKNGEMEPISNDVSSDSDVVETENLQNSSEVETGSSTNSFINKFPIADLEEVPHGVIRQARHFSDYEFPTHRLQQRLRNPNKLPLVIVACGSFSPITYLHLRMFEMALDAIGEHTRYEVIGGYYSPVSDNYKKPGLAPASHRVRMCELACERTSSWLMVDAWESLQPNYTRTAKVLDHFNEEINVKRGGVKKADGTQIGVKCMLLAGGDLIESMGEPNVWADADLHHILVQYGCLIVERTGSDVRSFLLSHDILYQHRRNILVIKQLIYNDISSTKVRLFIRRGMSVQYLLPNSVIRYIQEHGLYLNESEPVSQVIGNKD
ncbi:HGR022Cp [Eremothecium sinecaudum]|uniref:Nicotinamide-nucleotide adenylyltransferase n=1 Tax=Eremothecium sinecaudum TaxID=45286 RepID=A0A0X8HV88_9SACH|nr:HGR022Cp [Eremothecium sinecaudum]AMD22361.1 HGR022Cp [Eremothecium sinecaudum]